MSCPAGHHLPRRRRWTRVLRSSLRCFFFAIRLRRFLTTEPIRHASRNHVGPVPAHPQAHPTELDGGPPRIRRRVGRTQISGANRSSVAARRIQDQHAPGSGGLPERSAQIRVYGVLRHTERAADPHGAEFTAVDEPVDGHLGYPHERGDLGHGQEAHLCEALLGLGWTRHLLAPILSQAPPPRPVRPCAAAGGRACHQYGIETAVIKAMRSVK